MRPRRKKIFIIFLDKVLVERDVLQQTCSPELEFKVSQRSVREKFSLIQEKYKKKSSKDKTNSGTSMEVTE